MKYIKKQFLLIDRFGSKARFSINGHKTYQTVFGAIITIISYIIIFIFFLIFSKELIYHRKPNIITSELIDTSPIHFLFSDEFIWAISLQYSNYSNFIDETVYNLNAYVAISDVLENGTMKENRIFLDIVKCSNYTFKSIPEYFYSLDINNLYCVNLTGITLRGVYMEDKWTTINFQFQKCVNSTSNNNQCRSPDEITDILNGGYLGIFTTDYQILPNNYSQPAQVYAKNIFTTFSVQQYTDFWVYYQIKQINTDKGIFFDSIVSESVLTFEYTSENKDYRDSNIFLSVYIRESTNRKVLDRSYSKFQDIAAGVGGIIKIIFILGEIVTYFFRRTLYKNYILQFFNLDESKFEDFSKEEENNEMIKLQTNDVFGSDNNYKRNQSNNYSKSNLQSLSLNKNGTLKLKTKDLSPKRIKFFDSSNTNLKNSNFLNTKKEKEKRVSGTLGLKLPLGLNPMPLRNNIVIFNKKKNTAKHIVCFMALLIRKNSCERIREIHKQFNKILFLFDIIQYIKIRNEINLLEKSVFSEQERKNISNVYHFDYDLYTDKKGYDYLFLEHKSLNQNQNTDSIFKINAT
jgi:hypothetical protein